MLGRDLMEVGRWRGHLVFGMDLNDGDITSVDDVKRWLGEAHPDALINCAAYTDVDRAEINVELAMRVNGQGPLVLAEACAAAGVKLVQVSTDYVYACDLNRPLVETDRESPRSVYGRSKLEGDLAVRERCENHVICRTTWLYGLHGRNFVETILARSQEDQPLRVVDDQVGSPTWTVHLAGALVSLAGSSFTGTVHVANTGTVSWHGFACEILALAGLGDVKVGRMSTVELARPVERRPCSTLDTSLYSSLAEKPLPDWRQALSEYMARRRKAEGARPKA
jgi:dTDP-4-dehydrorhamnose reductase